MLKAKYCRNDKNCRDSADVKKDNVVTYSGLKQNPNGKIPEV